MYMIKASLIFLELALMFKGLGNSAFKLGASLVQQCEFCVFQAE